MGEEKFLFLSDQGQNVTRDTAHRTRHTAHRTFGLVDFVDKAWDHVPALNVKVVVRTVDVGWNDAGKVAAILLVVGPFRRLGQM